MRPLALALALVAVPAQAATYGPEIPTAPAPLPDGYRLVAPETMEADETRLNADTRTAWRRFWIGQGLVATDLALTCTILAKGGREINPIYGRGASCGKIIGIRAGASVLQYLIFRQAVRRDPTSAKRAAMWGIVIQGVPVGWNAYQLAK